MGPRKLIGTCKPDFVVNCLLSKELSDYDLKDLLIRSQN